MPSETLLRKWTAQQYCHLIETFLVMFYGHPHPITSVWNKMVCICDAKHFIQSFHRIVKFFDHICCSFFIQPALRYSGNSGKEVCKITFFRDFTRLFVAPWMLSTPPSELRISSMTSHIIFLKTVSSSFSRSFCGDGNFYFDKEEKQSIRRGWLNNLNEVSVPCIALSNSMSNSFFILTCNVRTIICDRLKGTVILELDLKIFDRKERDPTPVLAR